jgi:hypothetical protein
MNLGLEYVTIEPKYIKVRIYDLGIEGGSKATITVKPKKLNQAELTTHIKLIKESLGKKEDWKPSAEQSGAILLSVDMFNFLQRVKARKAGADEYNKEYTKNKNLLDKKIDTLKDPDGWFAKLMKSWGFAAKFEKTIKELDNKFKELLKIQQCRINEVAAGGTKKVKKCVGFEEDRDKKKAEELIKGIEKLLKPKGKGSGTGIPELKILQKLINKKVDRWKKGIKDKSEFHRIKDAKTKWKKQNSTDQVYDKSLLILKQGTA